MEHKIIKNDKELKTEPKRYYKDAIIIMSI